jgi:hypothetical protein
VGEFVEHARFGERVGALQEPILQHADPPRVEAIEAADAPTRCSKLIADVVAMGSAEATNVT